MAKFSFADTLAKLKATPPGKEASMYGPLRDVFVHVLGYPAADVDIDTTGEGGRPDVTARAPAGFRDASGKPARIDWVVVEAKDEPGSFRDPMKRESIFEKKAKYVGAHTAWFVMVEPDFWVLRAVGGGVLTADADIEIDTAGLTELQLKELAVGLLASRAGVSVQLERFRAGDTSMIAVEKLSITDPAPTKRLLNRVRLNRKRFFQQIRESTVHLQSAVLAAFNRLEPEIIAFSTAATAFWTEFGKADDGFEEHTLTLRGQPKGPETVRKHDRDSARLKRTFARSPHVARLAVSGLPEFQARTGVEDAKLKELFAIETANLILARVLLLRFFEDHQFFGETRYVCNGGVAAFQNMRNYFKASYAELLEHAYKEGSRLYSTAFEATELDWIFGAQDEGLSSAIELTLFRFARPDFTTIRGDILTGIYDRFMDRDQRKKLGEFYTPPSIARYMIQRMGVSRDSRVLDPACGSGTFLIESYRAMVGDDVERGAAEYSDVLATFSRIAGNDLNTFSAVQIQMLWQILAMKDEIEKQGFPDVLVTAKVNSLVERDQFTALDRFSDIDQADYDAVIGNPPYVRSERSAQALDVRSQKEFERGRANFPGVSSKLNAYALFLYRALDRWARPPDEQGRAGKVGFILPVSLFDGNETAPLRTLFAPGGRWAIRELVDLEIIYRQVFDADVLPAIFIVENRPATDQDTVSIRFADASCVLPHDADSLPEFNLGALPEAVVPYADLFSPDGRILTRVTPARLAILRKLWAQQTFADVAKPYWVRKEKSKIVEWVDQLPAQPALWDLRRMIAGGVAFRGNKSQCAGGIDVFKGENIIATELQGEPALTDADFDKIDDVSLWRFRDIHPARGLAVAQMAHCPNGVMFDPAAEAFTNTATILLPRNELAHVPFDLLLLSNVYVWFYALGARMGVLRTQRSHVYPTNLAFLPWNAALATRSAEIEALRASVVSACTHRLAAADSLKTALADLKYANVKARLQADADARVMFGDNFSDGGYETVIGEVSVADVDGHTRVLLSAEGLDWLDCNRPEIAHGLALALGQRVGEEVTRSQLLNMSIPVSKAESNHWLEVVAGHGEAALAQAMEDAIGALDAIVGECLSLDPADITSLQQDLTTDPFLRGIRPRYPGTVTRKMGFRKGLDSASRYE
jgi:hypothetical protein